MAKRKPTPVLVNYSEFVEQYCDVAINCSLCACEGIVSPVVRDCPNRRCLDPPYQAWHAGRDLNLSDSHNHSCYCAVHIRLYAQLGDADAHLQRRQARAEQVARRSERALAISAAADDLEQRAPLDGPAEMEIEDVEASGDEQREGLSPQSPTEHGHQSDQIQDSPESKTPRLEMLLHSYGLLLASEADIEPFTVLRPELDFIVRGMNRAHDNLEPSALFHVRVRSIRWPPSGNSAIAHRKRMVLCDCHIDNASTFLLNNVLNDIDSCINFDHPPDQHTLDCCNTISADPCIHELYIEAKCPQSDDSMERRNPSTVDEDPQLLSTESSSAWNVCPVLLSSSNRKTEQVLYSVAPDERPRRGCGMRGIIQFRRSRTAVRQDQSAAKCISPRCINMSRCPHVKRISDVTENDEIGDEGDGAGAVPAAVDVDGKFAAFKHDIPPPGGPYTAVQTTALVRRALMMQNDPFVCICGAPGECVCLEPCTDRSCSGRLIPVTDNCREMTCYGTHRAVTTRVYFSQKCSTSTCSVIRPWPLQDQCMFSLSPNVCMYLELMHDYHLQLTTAGMAVAKFHALTQKRYEEFSSRLAGRFGRQQFVNRQTFHQYCRQYIRWIRIDFQACFTCPMACGTLQTAPIIIADGTPLGANAVFAKTASFPPHESVKIRPTGGVTRAGSLFAERCLIRSPKLRAQIMALHDAEVNSDAERAAIAGIRGLCQTQPRYNWIEQAVDAALLHREDPQHALVDRGRRSVAVLRFLNQLAFPTPVGGGLVHYLGGAAAELRATLSTWCTDEVPRVDGKDFSVLQNRFPSLTRLICDLDLFLDGVGAVVPLWLVATIRFMLPFLDPCIGTPPGTADASNADNEWRDLGTDEGTQCRRWASSYTLPVRDLDVLAQESCTKKAQTTTFRLPGLFLLYCPHGICLGFSLMKVPESPHTMFCILFNRLKRAPPILIYDNACNTHEYIMSRESKFMEKCSLFIDRLHIYNHRGCSEGYDLHKFDPLKAVNSEVCEQKNSGFVMLRTQCAYMTTANFGRLTRLFIGAQNDDRRATLLADHERTSNEPLNLYLLDLIRASHGVLN